MRYELVHILGREFVIRDNEMPRVTKAFKFPSDIGQPAGHDQNGKVIFNIFITTEWENGE